MKIEANYRLKLTAGTIDKAAEYIKSLGFSIDGKPSFFSPNSKNRILAEVKFSGSLEDKVAELDEKFGVKHGKSGEYSGLFHTWELPGNRYVTLVAFKYGGYEIRLEQ